MLSLREKNFKPTQKEMNHRKIKNHPLELISRPEATTASQENDAAKIQNKIEIARNNLKKVAEIYEGADASLQDSGESGSVFVRRSV